MNDPSRNPYRSYRTDELERDALAYSAAISRAQRRSPDHDTTALRANLCDIVAELDSRQTETRENPRQDIGQPLEVVRVRGKRMFAAGAFGGGFALEDGRHFGSGV